LVTGAVVGAHPVGDRGVAMHCGVAVAHRVRSYGGASWPKVVRVGDGGVVGAQAVGDRSVAMHCGVTVAHRVRSYGGAAWRRLYGGCPLPRKRERGNGRCGQRAGVSVRLSIITRGADGWSL
jgi:hypothetical protein